MTFASTLILVSYLNGFFPGKDVFSKSIRADILEGFWTGMRSGTSGALAGSLQVILLMWMRTVMNVQYMKGGTFSSRLRELWQEGGFRRLYRGIEFALVQNPISRFGDTACNTGGLAILKKLFPSASKAFYTAVTTFVASVWRLFITPVDAIKTILQVHGTSGFSIIKKRYKKEGFRAFWSGGLAIIFVNWAGAYPWFLTYNILQDVMPEYGTNLVGQYIPREAFIGLFSSIVSDSCTNSIRILKTIKQVNNELGYLGQAFQIVENDGLQSLLGRGLKTRIVGNAVQSALFSTMWKTFDKNAPNSSRNSQRCFSVIGAGNRAVYFIPPLKYAQHNLDIEVCGVYTRSGRLHPLLVNEFPNMRSFTNLRAMIVETKPKVILILTHGDSNGSVLHDVLVKGYRGFILIETPTPALSELILDQKHRIGVLENWPWLPLEILKQKAVRGGILGNVTRVANVQRSICTHGAAKARKYAGSHIPITLIKKEVLQRTTHIKAKDPNGVVIENIFPKGNVRDMLIVGTLGSLRGNCIVNMEDNSGILRLFRNRKLVQNFKVEVFFGKESNTDLPEKIIMQFESRAFVWENELKSGAFNTLDQKQYGSLQHILAINDGVILYPLEQHLVDLQLC